MASTYFAVTLSHHLSPLVTLTHMCSVRNREDVHCYFNVAVQAQCQRTPVIACRSSASLAVLT